MKPSRAIRILSDEAVNKVAAGEVVERPAAALKELLENSVDAGAGSIEVSLKGSGRRLIRVADDGSGMARDDALLSLERHATSKISGAEDLERVATLGFRGEALPSLAAVSKMQITTRPSSMPEGTRIIVDGGKILKVSPCGSPPGTEVEIRHLFRNVPARLKFLKSGPTELSHCLRITSSLALAHPHLKLSLSHEGRESLRFASQPDEAGRLKEYLGGDYFESLLPFSASEGHLKAFGFVSAPGKGRAGSGYQQLLVNGRPVRDGQLQSALRESCRDYFPVKSAPLSYFIWIELPVAELDVNVHPTKREVRFRNLPALRSLVGNTLVHTLRRSETSWYGRNDAAASVAPTTPAAAPPPAAADGSASYEKASSSSGELFPPPAPPADGSRVEGEFPPDAPSLQLFSTYIIIPRPDALVLVDQHAAHERIMYEKILKLLDEGVSQRLLAPPLLDISAADELLLEELTPTLARYGIETEPCGPGIIRVVSLPLDLPEEGALSFIREFLDRIARGDQIPEVADFRHDIAAVMACHGSVRANRKMLPLEASTLVEELFTMNDPSHCPHGRPTFIRLDRKEIEKRFRRL